MGTTGINARCGGVAAEYYAGSATTKTDLAVWTDRNEFIVQSDAGTTSTNRASYLMQIFPLTTNNSGDTASGLANGELSYSAGEYSTSGGPIKVLGFQLAPGETVSAANVKCIVRIVSGVGIWGGATHG
jgi:hypothetical protein